jgi:hypothetical protein
MPVSIEDVGGGELSTVRHQLSVNPTMEGGKVARIGVTYNSMIWKASGLAGAPALMQGNEVLRGNAL